MLHPANRLRYKVFTSFAIAACAFLAVARFATETQLSAQAALVYAVLAIFGIAGFWRGMIFLRAVRDVS